MKQHISFPDGRQVLNLGQGTWKMGEDNAKRKSEINALRTGIDHGLTLIDTAEMYADGEAERVVGEAIKPYNRDDLFLVSKVYPHHADEEHLFKACDQTLLRMGVDELDLYLLHWPGRVPMQETIDCFEELKRLGKIKGWGVSNFDSEDTKEMLSLRDGEQCQVNQVLYHLASRGIEFALTDLLKEHHIPIMAYCPIIGQEPELKEKVHNHPLLKRLAETYRITITQLLLAFVMHQENTIAIPKAASSHHVLQNKEVLDIQLTEEDYTLIDQAFPAPDYPTPLAVQ